MHFSGGFLIRFIFAFPILLCSGGPQLQPPGLSSIFQRVGTDALDIVKRIPRPPIAPLEGVLNQFHDTIRSTLVDDGSPLASTRQNFLSQNKSDVRFYYYGNKENTSLFTELVYGDSISFNDSSFDGDKPVKILIHGFWQNSTSSFPQGVKNAYLRSNLSDNNVICVDWGALGQPRYLTPVLYPLAADNVPRVGQRVAEFVTFMLDDGLINNLTQVHIVGFSLGAHVAGIAGNRIRNLTDGDSVARITGLDPAGPKFYAVTPQNGLDSEDATFVDIIHTNEGMLGNIGILGHADFYPNGGSLQPKCIEDGDGARTFFTTLNDAVSGSCSHNKAPDYFARSIRTMDMYACKCSSWMAYQMYCWDACDKKVLFGEFAPTTARGKYFLEVDKTF